MRLQRFGFLVALLTLPAGAYAHRVEPINTEYGSTVSRPFVNAAIDGFRFSMDGNRSHIISPTVGMEVPIWKRFQFQFAVPFQYSRQELVKGGGLGDIVLGAKYMLSGEHDSIRPNIGFNFEVALPTGKREIGLGQETEYETGLHINNSMGPVTNFVNLNYSVGLPRDREPGEENAKSIDFKYAVVLQVTRNLYPTLELLTTRHLASGETEIMIVPEIQYLAGEHAILKFGVPAGLNRSAPDWGVQFKLAITW